jgi:hypothetical protein
MNIPSDRLALVTIAEWATDEGHLDCNVQTVLHFFEKPHNYPEVFTAWDEYQTTQGELQDERRATL